MKKYQKIMIWFLPLIVIGGIFVPYLGYLMLIMMAIFLPLSYFKGRFWCSNLCPRGAFLDGILSKVSFGNNFPKLFSNIKFRWGIFVLFVLFITYRLSQTGGSIILIGAVFVSMCLITTIISIVLGVATRHRAWCALCPMGTLQGKLHTLRNKNKKQNL